MKMTTWRLVTCLHHCSFIHITLIIDFIEYRTEFLKRSFPLIKTASVCIKPIFPAYSQGFFCSIVWEDSIDWFEGCFVQLLVTEWKSFGSLYILIREICSKDPLVVRLTVVEKVNTCYIQFLKRCVSKLNQPLTQITKGWPSRRSSLRWCSS